MGAGGSGMSAIAGVLLTMGHDVSGSDSTPSAVLDRLAAAGARVHAGHRPDAIDGVEVVLVSTAIPADDPEVVAARAAGIPVLRRAEALTAICAVRRTLAVSGTHGKTTTTAMLALALREAGAAPSFIVGGDIGGLGNGSAWDQGELFVVEADESDGTFVELAADGVIVTNVEPDHLDHWGSFDALKAAFLRFVADAPGPRIVCADDPGAAAIAAAVGGCVTYGTSESATYRITEVVTDRDGVRFVVNGRPLSLPSPGIHNARNATAVLALCTELGIDPDAVVRALGAFAGVGRRFERRGEARGVTFIDSYDHLPTEVAAVLAAARAGGWQRVVCVFQPHRYTRTAALWREFADAFVDADVIAITDIYAAGQQPIDGVSGKLILNAVLDAHSRSRVAWLPERDGLRKWLLSELRSGDLCLTLGAGDLTTLPDELLRALE
ncbi:MAG: murC [Acidimicrobiales bacterium]|nr:murC [Acidimicrobiales bacterium]